FFFQAEDGIRDRNVTGVQTCALPIFPDQPPQTLTERSGGVRRGGPPAGARTRPAPPWWGCPAARSAPPPPPAPTSGPSPAPAPRSEERRVGKGRSTRGLAYGYRKTGK